MARAKFQTLTEQMFYILLCLHTECYGLDLMEQVRLMTDDRVIIGPGTLYNLLDQFVDAEMIYETRAEGRRRCYLITDKGKQALKKEDQRLGRQMADYRRITGEEQTS